MRRLEKVQHSSLDNRSYCGKLFGRQAEGQNTAKMRYNHHLLLPPMFNVIVCVLLKAIRTQN